MCHGGVTEARHFVHRSKACPDQGKGIQSADDARPARAVGSRHRNPQRERPAGGARVGCCDRGRVGALRGARRVRLRARRRVAVGLAGLVRLLPAAASPRSRRRWATGSGASAFSSRCSWSGRPRWPLRPRRPSRTACRCSFSSFAAVIGSRRRWCGRPCRRFCHRWRGRREELIASNGATSTVEGARHSCWARLAGVLASVTSVGVVFLAGAAVLLAGASLLARVSVEGRIVVADAADGEALRRMVVGGLPGDCPIAGRSAPRRARRRAGLCPRLFERPDRGRASSASSTEAAAEVGYLTAAMGSAG